MTTVVCLASEMIFYPVVNPKQLTAEFRFRFQKQTGKSEFVAPERGGKSGCAAADDDDVVFLFAFTHFLIYKTPAEKQFCLIGQSNLNALFSSGKTAAAGIATFCQ